MHADNQAQILVKVPEMEADSYWASLCMDIVHRVFTEHHFIWLLS